ncbi:hypothetical protein CYLTODRAFT_282743 [Cylindrobasidium torrendii FP15055 ss-10]|uniref:Uncharacterized protein n=1 Tax=Cylindrobasidium torrendii FP15055 ss-10 TaxID=1314674 RepID=A0A0D7BBW2_9AGAR|nr:hypothetical protein CYLTODRAFT_282743 [Cylindrobasidium torrendii FP15055 ss-10]
MAKDNTTPSPRASIRARMGSAVRRTSSIFGTPKPSGSSAKSVHSNDSSSAKNVDAPAPIVVSTENLHEHAQHQSHVPSPIAESPAREAAALSAQTPVVGPSPLVQSVLHDEPVSIGSMAPSLNENEDAPPAAPVQEEAEVTKEKAESTDEEVGVGAGTVSNEDLRPAPSSDKVSIATQADEPELEPEAKDVPAAVEPAQAEPKVEEQAPSAEASVIDSPPPPPAPGTMAAASSYFEDRSAIDAPSTPIRAAPIAPSVHQEEDDDLSAVWGQHAPNGVPTACVAAPPISFVGLADFSAPAMRRIHLLIRLRLGMLRASRHRSKRALNLLFLFFAGSSSPHS